MGTWDINLDKQTATSINGITFKLTKAESGIYRGVCLILPRKSGPFAVKS